MTAKQFVVPIALIGVIPTAPIHLLPAYSEQLRAPVLGTTLDLPNLIAEHPIQAVSLVPASS
jgi:hypothetical protein